MHIKLEKAPPFFQLLCPILDALALTEGEPGSMCHLTWSNFLFPLESYITSVWPHLTSTKGSTIILQLFPCLFSYVRDKKCIMAPIFPANISVPLV